VQIISVLCAAIGLGGLYAYLNWLGPLYSPAHTIIDILYYTGPKGDVILVQDLTSISFRGAGASYGRLTMIDAATGKVTNKVSTGSNYRDHKNLDVQVLLDDKIWYTSYTNGFHARDPYTGEIVTDMKKMVEPYSQLNYRKASKVNTPDGYVFSRKPPDFEFSVDSFPGNTVNGNETFMKYYRHDHKYLIRKDWLKMVGRQDTSYTPLFLYDDKVILNRENGYCFEPMRGDAKMMQFRHVHSTFEGNADYSPDYRVDTLINRQLQLKSGTIIENYLLHNPASVLIHYETIDSTFKTGFRVSRMDLKGNMIWEVSDEQMGGVPSMPYEHKQTSAYTYNRGTLYIVVGTQVVALDGRTGKKKWSTNLGR
jgi:outer membrane protein assembly factor BamB